MKTSHAIIDFLNSKSISSEVLDIQITKRINTYLADYWQGTTGKINWNKINSETKKVVFSQDITDTYLVSIVNPTQKCYKLIIKSNCYYKDHELLTRFS